MGTIGFKPHGELRTTWRGNKKKKKVFIHLQITTVAKTTRRDIPGLIVIIATVQQWWKQTWCLSSHADRGVCHIW